MRRGISPVKSGDVSLCEPVADQRLSAQMGYIQLDLSI